MRIDRLEKSVPPSRDSPLFQTLQADGRVIVTYLSGRKVTQGTLEKCKTYLGWGPDAWGAEGQTIEQSEDIDAVLLILLSKGISQADK